jgi:hypothetical protein
MQTYPPSKYLPIWDTLKVKGTCVLVVPLAYQRRVIKAVIKRKDEDLGYKLLMSEAYKKVKLSYKIEGTVITFNLKFYPIYHIGAL